MKATHLRATLAMALLLVAGCAALRPYHVVPPEVALVNIVPVSATLFEQRLRVDLRIRNPNDFNLDLAGLDFRLTVNGNELATGLSNDAVVVPHLGESTASVTVTTTAVAWLRQLRAFTATQELSYDLAGHIHLAHGRRLPFRHSGSFPPADLLNPSPRPGPPPDQHSL